MTHLRPVVLGMLGVLIGLAAWHAYVDHVNLHALVNLVQQSAQSAPPSRPSAAPKVP